jgi:hypothetical protein
MAWADEKNFLEHWKAEHEHQVSRRGRKSRKAQELEAERGKNTQLTEEVSRLGDENRQLRQEQQNRLQEENLRLNNENQRLKNDRKQKARAEQSGCCVVLWRTRGLIAITCGATLETCK